VGQVVVIETGCEGEDTHIGRVVYIGDIVEE